MRNPVAPSVDIKLDKKRKLILDLNAMVAFEDEAGKSVAEIGANMSMKDMRALLWAALLAEDPDVTLDTVGKHIYPQRLQELSGLIDKLFTVSMPDAESTTEEPEGKN